MAMLDRTVLIVEDNEKTSKMLNFLFMSKGCRIETAKNGIEALESLKKTIPDVVILDLMMPDMDGFDFCSNIRRESKYKDVPIIVLSALREKKHKDRLKLMGIYDYIEKPFSAAEIVERVSKVTSSWEFF